MRNAMIALTFLLAAGPSLAGGVDLTLPRLTWPTDSVVTESTKGCVLTEDQETAPTCR